ncbi:sulfite exporter TauE/SafE family protein [Ferrovum sp. PN-J185]|uniref:sulfite exporter TauE/SafE family protein n=1 Tax=Ferrovum sp. PN-J185 TaxID=1356306 RepID=UPI001E5E0FC4|nr:sulfite exporter TauE/SafE family protein [Ferrovum sp. PN-J185]MCC6068812.1 sulfite exporter TauE/SafE family protein [Ferrovum sp. PN-J185]
MHWSYALSGLLGGFLVGLTGVGGGSLMTPLLILVFKINPLSAVGTDLLYAAITKLSGTLIHHRKKNIDWHAVSFLSLGSIPASLITLSLAGSHWQQESFRATIRYSLALALFLTALALLWGWRNLYRRETAVQITQEIPYKRFISVVVGMVIGSLVTLSSVGAGAVGTTALLLLYPKLPLSRIIGTDIAHAIPITLIAGMGHLALGEINFSLLINLLIGSIPGIWLGTQLNSKISEKITRPFLAILLAGIAAKLVLI